MSDSLSPSELVLEFEKLTLDKLNKFCPEEEVKISSQDKPWINFELKTIHRKKSREYVKRG